MGYACVSDCMYVCMHTYVGADAYVYITGMFRHFLSRYTYRLHAWVVHVCKCNRGSCALCPHGHLRSLDICFQYICMTAYMHSCLYEYSSLHKHTHIHTYIICTYIHTYIHTYIQSSFNIVSEQHTRNAVE